MVSSWRLESTGSVTKSVVLHFVLSHCIYLHDLRLKSLESRDLLFVCYFPFFSPNYFYQLEANYFTVLQWFLPHTDMNQPWIYMYSPSRSSRPPPSPSYPSGSSQCTSPEHPVSCIEPGLAICFTYDNIHAILSKHPTLAFSHRVQKSVLYICVSFSVLHIGLSLPSF